ncbi:TonB-dependent receptor [Desulfosarcina variabilis str. Montpellier]|uniref:TonB-dependent receptor n=1 Tax=Desulfosarcina variabilis TaxID=2300 RepID=UPI003AFB1CA4
MMKRLLGVGIALMVLVFYLPAMAEEPMKLEEIVVTEKKLVKPTKQTNETVYTGSEITREGIDAQGAKASVSVYEAVNVLPGVSVESVDPYGLAAEQKNIRTRGVRGYLGAMTVAGVPNYGGNPMGPREYLYDMENVESIAVYKGAVPADLGTGVGARGGALELRPRWPEEQWGVDFGQGFGENGYTRSFLRLDSGDLPVVGSRLSVSGSYTDAEKWKGPGDLGPRKNASIMLAQPINDQDEITFWFNYNDLEQNLYKPLTYVETQDLSANYENDYNSTLTGTAALDINYYDYNRGDYCNRDFLSVIPLTFSDAFKLSVKPYYSKEDTEILGGTASMGGSVQKRMREIERYGLISQADYHISGVTASLGYWYEDSDMVISQQFYNPTNFAFKGYGMVMENDGDGIVHSPYFKLAGSVGAFDWQAGLKYFYYKDPASQGYTASAPDYELVKADDLYRQEKTYDELLPTLGIDYRITDSLEVTASYGRNQIRPYAYVPLVTTYNSNRADFQAAGVTLDDMFSGYDMEISDTFELGARFCQSWMEIMPTVFFAKHKNLLTTVHDPRIGDSGVNYYQNVGEATGYGVEVETNFFLGDHVTFFLNPTYTSLTYDEDLTYAGATLQTKDNQVVDTPEWMLKAGLILTWGDFEVVPMLRYLDDRFGDAENTETVDSYMVADLKIGYKKNDIAFFDALKISLEFTNLFDEEYVSLINGMDDSRAGRTSYYVGAPFTTLLSVSLEI